MVRPSRRRAPPKRPRRSKARPPRSGFVGRDPSPVLDHYPPRQPAGFSPPPRPLPSAAPSPPARAASPAASGAPAPSSAHPPEGLIRLEREFDPDEFSERLGETAIRVTVPRDALAEVLRRVTEFMGFGIYVYAISVRPAASELLRGYVVELQRIDYDAASGAWKPFVERGAAPAPDDGAP